ncbi:YgjV family protein [Floccifex sp.]|uniref:YgjV family protein n=1 Tax=Floccifex sp. TaxID=2815810 RepID=UPI003F04EA90
MNLLIGNAIALLGSFVMIGIGFLKKKEQIILAQCLQCFFMGLSNLVLGGITGVITNLFTILRNLISFKIEFKSNVKILFIVVQWILAFVLHQIQWINLLPILSTSIFTWYMDCKNPITFKIVVIGTLIMWLIYDFSIQNYVASFFDVITICTNTFTLIQMKKRAI